MNLCRPEWFTAKSMPAYNWDPVMGCKRDCCDCISKQLGSTFLASVYETEKSCLEKMVINAAKDAYNKCYGDIETLKFFQPVFLWTRYLLKFPEQPAQMLVNAAADINYWQTRWMDKVLEKINKYPQHRFFFLTRNINTYNQYRFPMNCWLGVVVDNTVRLHAYETVYNHRLKSGAYRSPANLFFIIKSRDVIRISPLYYTAKWLIFSAGKGHPAEVCKENEAMDPVIRHYRQTIPVFMETDFKCIWKNELIREFPDFDK